MKKTSIIVIIGLLLFVIAIFAIFLPIYFNLFGNPINKFIVPNKIVEIIEERYDEKFTVIDKNYSYSVDYQEAVVTLQSTKHPDIEFEASTYQLSDVTNKTVSDNYVETLWGKRFDDELKPILDELLAGVSYTTDTDVVIHRSSDINENGEILPYGDESMIFVPNIHVSKDFEENDINMMKEIIFFVQEQVKHSTIYLKFNDGPQYMCGGNSNVVFTEGDDINNFCEKPYE